MKSKAILIVCAFLAAFVVSYFAIFREGDEVVANQATVTASDKDSIASERGDPLKVERSGDHGSARAGAKILVYVTGAVASPGLYELSGPSTIGDVVKAAGGLLRFADTESINLAQGAESGTHLHIPFVFTGTAEELLRSQRLNINTATEEELVSIRGIGPTAAKKIVDYRKEKGNFQTVDELTKIKGIGPALLKKIGPYITT